MRRTTNNGSSTPSSCIHIPLVTAVLGVYAVSSLPPNTQLPTLHIHIRAANTNANADVRGTCGARRHGHNINVVNAIRHCQRHRQRRRQRCVVNVASLRRPIPSQRTNEHPRPLNSVTLTYAPRSLRCGDLTPSMISCCVSAVAPIVVPSEHNLESIRSS